MAVWREDLTPSPALRVPVTPVHLGQATQSTLPLPCKTPQQTPAHALSKDLYPVGIIATVCSLATFPNENQTKKIRESEPSHIPSSINTIK